MSLVPSKWRFIGGSISGPEFINTSNLNVDARYKLKIDLMVSFARFIVGVRIIRALMFG